MSQIAPKPNFSTTEHIKVWDWSWEVARESAEGIYFSFLYKEESLILTWDSNSVGGYISNLRKIPKFLLRFQTITFMFRDVLDYKLHI